MAIGLCNSIWSSANLSQRMPISIMVTRFVLDLHLYYNHSQHLSYYPSTSHIMRSVSSSIKTVTHLSPSHHVIMSTRIGYISSYSLMITCYISLITLFYYLHTHSYLFVCGSSLLLAAMCSITLSSHSLSPYLTQLSSHLLDHYNLKVDPLGNNTCITILIHT